MSTIANPNPFVTASTRLAAAFANREHDDIETWAAHSPLNMRTLSAWLHSRKALRASKGHADLMPAQAGFLRDLDELGIKPITVAEARAAEIPLVGDGRRDHVATERRFGLGDAAPVAQAACVVDPVVETHESPALNMARTLKAAGFTAAQVAKTIKAMYG